MEVSRSNSSFLSVHVRFEYCNFCGFITAIAQLLELDFFFLLLRNSVEQKKQTLSEITGGIDEAESLVFVHVSGTN